MSEQRWVTTDYRVTADGGLSHKRWLNPDNSLKTGLDLKREKLRVELEVMARRLVALTKEMPADESTRCPFCNVFPFREEPLHGHYICSNCRNVTSGCCNGETG